MGFQGQCEIASPSGASINLLWREAEGAPRAVVHVSHGLGEQAGDYADFADALAARGFHVHAHDHRGHGLTRARDALPGHFGSGGGAEKVLADMGAVEEFIARKHPGLPVILFGNGVGGLIALNFVLREPSRVAALALREPPALRTGLIERAALAWERFRLGADVPSRVMRSRLQLASVGSWGVVLSMQEELARQHHLAAAFRSVPILIVREGRQDRNAEALGGRLRKMGISNVALHRESGAGSDDGIAATLRDWAKSILD